jgi:N-acetylgalactosamine-6-sulfatase
MPSTRPRPNIVLVIADDLGQGDLSLTGSVRIRTPHLDRLGHNGSRFHGFSVASPVCSPSRAGVLTGQWPARHGIHNAYGSREAAVKDGMPPWLDPGAVLLPRLLRSAGYHTAHYGKWHLAASDDARGPPPQAYGYDDYRGFNGPPNSAVASASQIFGLAVSFIARRGAKPAFVVVAAHEPHTPHQPSLSALERFAHLPRENERIYAAAVADLDDGVGRLVHGLRLLDEFEQTLLSFFSDNGPEHSSTAEREGVRRTCKGAEKACVLRCGEGCSVGQTAGLRGRKRSLFEGGVASPLLVSWPSGGVRSGHADATSVLNAVDLLPTLCALAGAVMPAGYQPDGEDVTAAMIRGQPVKRRRSLLWEYQGFAHTQHTKDGWAWLAVREGNWKLVASGDRRRVELFDLERDPFEKASVAEAAANAAVVARLERAVVGWQAELPPGRLGNRTAF